MAQRLEQTQTQTQQQQLSPLQLALSKLLELPVADLAVRVQNEMLDNAALEEAGGDADAFDETSETPAEAGEYDAEMSDPEAGNVADALSDYLTADDVPAYLQERADAAREYREVPQADAVSFYDNLQRQIAENELTDHERQVLEYLIGSLDADGLLRTSLLTLEDELAVYHNVETSQRELEHLLSILHTFEPRGIGARSLQECLRLQLTDPEMHFAHREKALEVVDRCFDDFMHKRWNNIMSRLGVSESEFEAIRRELTHLNPQPGSALSESAGMGAPTVIPDFYVSVGSDGVPSIRLNRGDVPELRVSRAFRDTVSAYADSRTALSREQRDAYTYARRKVEAAVTFIDSLRRRQQTLLAVMTAIVELQRPFFDEDDETRLRAMTLKDVASRIGVDISTVSRVTGSKYVQTDYGIYPLKFFFSTQFVTEAGDELSARRVKAALRELLETEDKKAPLADQVLAERLKEAGFPVARRTVAKYREQLGFPPARLRR